MSTGVGTDRRTYRHPGRRDQHRPEQIEQTPVGGNEVRHPAGNVPLGTKFSYVIGLTGGNTISLVINGGATQKCPSVSVHQQIPHVLQSRRLRPNRRHESVGVAARHRGVSGHRRLPDGRPVDLPIADARGQVLCRKGILTGIPPAEVWLGGREQPASPKLVR